MDAAALIRGAIDAAPHLRVLIVAHTFPSAFAGHPGQVVFVGSVPPPEGAAAGHLTAYPAPTHADVVLALTALRPHAPFDLVFIDHDHGFMPVVEQFNAAVAHCHAATVVLLDDAVPPSFGMAGPRPTEAWWVGEVWMLAPLLRGSAARLHVLDVPPTGLLAAQGVSALHVAAAAAAAAALAAAGSVADIRRVLDPLRAADPGLALRALLSQITAAAGPSLRLDASAAGIIASEITDAAGPWDRAPPLVLLDLSGTAADLSPLGARTRMRPERRVDTFADACLTGYDTLVAGGAFHAREIGHGPAAAARVVREAARSGTPLRARDGGIELPTGAARLPVDAHAVLGTPDEPLNWGMWLLYGVPSAALFTANRDRFDRYITATPLAWQRPLLSALGVTPEDLVEHVPGTVPRVREVTMIRRQWRDLSVAATDRALFGALSARFADPSAPRRIFVARRGMHPRPGGYRTLRNEDALLDGVAALGLTVIHPETLDFAGQVRAFGGAEVIVGLGGAGMFNAVFAAPGARVMTIESSLTWADAHLQLLASCGHATGFILGCQDADDLRPVHRNWTLDVPAALAAIRRFAA